MLIDQCDFIIGDVYLFHRSQDACPSATSLWGMFDIRRGRVIYLESSTEDHRNFRLWHPLPDEYRYCRLSTRSELRDYMVNLICNKICKFN